MTINVSDRILKDIQKIVGDGRNKLYPSRSELIRSAIRDYLLEEIFKLQVEEIIEEPVNEEEHLKQLCREALNKEFKPQPIDPKQNPYLEELSRSKIGIF